jgi:hypothetical protein
MKNIVYVILTCVHTIIIVIKLLYKHMNLGVDLFIVFYFSLKFITESYKIYMFSVSLRKRKFF